MKGVLTVNQRRPSALILVVAVALAACTTPSGGSGSEAPSGGASQGAISNLSASIAPTPSPTPTPTPSASTDGSGGPVASGPSPTPGDIDPCTLLTQKEASAVMGMALGPGVSQQAGPDRACTFRSGLTEVRLILAPKAADAATAQAYWDAEKSQIPATVHVTTLTAFDRSAYSSGETAGVSISALFVIDGPYFFDLFCGFPACTQTASLGGAEHIAGRLP